MFYINRKNPTTGEQEGVALVSDFTQEDGGVMVWMGWFEGAEATPITKGMVIPQWIIWDNKRNNTARTDLTVTKVNRVTIKVRAEDDGQEYEIRIDR